MESYGKSARFIVKQEQPFNGEPPLELLLGSTITPVALFFARNHGNIPQIDPGSYRLMVGGAVEQPLSLTVEDLRRRFPSYTVTATLQCAGNRRAELIRHAPIPGELPWDAGAIGTAVWTGVRLADVLAEAGVGGSARHVHLTGLDQVERQERTFGFGGSIPLEKALQPEVLLAYGMNGEELQVEHGFPLRLVAPGYVGARSVKWLGEVSLRAGPSDNYFYAHAYQLFPPWAEAGEVDWSSGIKLGEMPVSSVICRPAEGERIEGGPVKVQGYAFAGGGRRVERVDVSGDGGRTWQAAQLGEDAGAWAWRLWETEMELPAGEAEIVVRACDAAANTQPQEISQVWNFKGYINNAWHRVRVTVLDG